MKHAALPLILKKRCFGCHTGDGVAADELDFSQIGALRGAGTEIVDELNRAKREPGRYPVRARSGMVCESPRGFRPFVGDYECEWLHQGQMGIGVREVP